MIERYSRKEIKKIWDEKNKYQIWLDIEIAAAQAMEKYKRCLTRTDTFAEWTIESVANQVKQATDDDWIDLFTDRYLDFNKIPDLNL